MKIIGVEEIEKITNRTFVDLCQLKQYGLPMSKENGKPCLDTDKVKNFLKPYGKTIEEITVSDIIAQERREAAYNCTEDIDLIGAASIAEFLGWLQTDFVARYMDMKAKGCPIRKENGQLVVNAKELASWINAINKEAMLRYRPEIARPEQGCKHMMTRPLRG